MPPPQPSSLKLSQFLTVNFFICFSISSLKLRFKMIKWVNTMGIDTQAHLQLTVDCWFIYLVSVIASDSTPLICSDSIVPPLVRLIQFVLLQRTFVVVPLCSVDWLFSLHLHRICKLDSGIVCVHVMNVLNLLFAARQCGILLNFLFVELGCCALIFCHFNCSFFLSFRRLVSKWDSNWLIYN